MIIKKLKLTNFRSYKNAEIEFSPCVNFLVGKNAQGKTNLVEPIYILSTLKSFKNSTLLDCIMEDEPFSEIEAVVKTDFEGTKTIRYKIKREGENEYYVNENKITKKKDCLSNIFSVIFSPDELRLVKGSPDIRRDFLDTDISQVSKYYCDLLDRYNHILQNRNKLLKTCKDRNKLAVQLDVWDIQLANVGSAITITRQNFLTKISSYSNDIMNLLSNGKESLEIKYVGLKGQTREAVNNNFLTALTNSRDKDYEVGYTTVGPHRDDIKFFVNNKEVKPFASQGQQRTVVLALKFAELEVIKNEKEQPVLILDDVFSELDLSRQKFILEYLKEKQIFVTSTSVKKPEIENYKKFRIKNSTIKEEKFITKENTKK